MGGAVALALMVTVTGVGQYLPSFTERYAQVTSPTEAGSWNARMYTIDFAWTRLLKDPIVGEGLHHSARGTYDGVTTVHNSILRAWYQGGLLLGIAYGAMFLAILSVVVRSVCTRRYGCEASILAAISVYAMTSPLLEQRHLWLPVLVCWASISYAESVTGVDGGDVLPRPAPPSPATGRSVPR
jgi:O-antigen ligase